MVAQVAADGTISISIVAYLNGDPKIHGHSEMVIAPTDEDYDAWLAFLKISPGEHTRFHNWPQFYLDKFDGNK